MVLGHEGAGLVQDIGLHVASIMTGDRVGFAYIHKICGNCENCLSGK